MLVEKLLGWWKFWSTRHFAFGLKMKKNLGPYQLKHNFKFLHDFYLLALYFNKKVIYNILICISIRSKRFSMRFSCYVTCFKNSKKWFLLLSVLQSFLLPCFYKIYKAWAVQNVFRWKLSTRFLRHDTWIMHNIQMHNFDVFKF